MKKRIQALEKALREIDEIRHKMKTEIYSQFPTSPFSLKKFINDLKAPCMVLFADHQVKIDKDKCNHEWVILGIGPGARVKCKKCGQKREI